MFIPLWGIRISKAGQFGWQYHVWVNYFYSYQSLDENLKLRSPLKTNMEKHGTSKNMFWR